MSDEIHMNIEQLAEWQEHMEFTSQEAADAHDIHLNTFLNYRRGYRSMREGDQREVPIPKDFALACEAMANGLTEYVGDFR